MKKKFNPIYNSLFVVVILLAPIFLTDCIQPSPSPKTTFTLKGKVLDGTTMKPFASQSLDAMATDWNRNSVDLGTCMLQEDGSFSLKYARVSLSEHPTITLSGNSIILENIPVNKNIDSVIYLSTMGALKVYLNIQKTINPTDTLFIGLPIFNSGGELASIEVDTILQPKSGYFRTFRLATPSETIHYGVGSKDFNYDYFYQKFKNPGHLVSFPVKGDPYIDNATLTF